MIEARADETAPITLAAVDLGSNSFHMVIARFLTHDLQTFDHLREPVRLAAGLDENGELSEEAQERAIACLERFGQRLRAIPDAHVRAVGTNTLRQARKVRGFAERALRALGTEVEIISGQEEARLIYLGVTQSHATRAARKLVVDIGGGSTEIVAGRGFDVLEAHSLYMGCVGYSRRYFPEGRLDRENFRQAETAAGLELQSIGRSLREIGWETAIGASGTINAIGEILRQNEWAEQNVTLVGMKKLRKALVRFGSSDKVELRGLTSSRLPVLPGGLAILMAVFKALEIDEMRSSSGALREGVLYDLAGRMRHEDVRDRTIRRFLDQYDADRAQAARVERTALNLLAQLRQNWKIDTEEGERLLEWASHLHEIGIAVSHAGFQKHGAYLVRHSDMPGFAEEEQKRIAALIRIHRRKLTRATLAEYVDDSRTELLLRLGVLLRISVLLNRSRTTSATPDIEVSSDWTQIRLRFPAGWMVDHPLTVADIERETDFLAAVQIHLEIEEERRGDAIEADRAAAS